jgi:hypothetical protein
MTTRTAPSYPRRLRVGEVEFERRDDFYALPKAAAAARKDALAVMNDDEGNTLAIYPGRPRARAAGADIRAVYSEGQDGPLAVPTGLIFVRLGGSVRPQARSGEFARAGFRIERTLSYAPDAAWLRAARGGAAAALAGLEGLRNVPDVVHVEPQMLRERALK